MNISYRMRAAVAASALLVASGCQKFLDVNTNPNAPQSVSTNLYLSPELHWFVTSPQYDGRFIGRYTQEWFLANGQTAISTWDRMGYDPASDNGAEQWRDVYWSLGQGLEDMIAKAKTEQRWDLVGVGYTLKAWGWEVLTDMHGEIIVKEAFDPTRPTFDYDTQDFVYTTIQALLDTAITNLNRTDGAVDPVYLGKTDIIYGGDRTKWLKLAHGLLAMNLNHYSNKATYNPTLVMAEVDSSFTSNADDAMLAYPCTDPASADCNFWGRTRNNITSYRQTQFVVHLMDGTDFGVVDPRMSRMLAPSPDGQYRGVDPTQPGYGALTTTQQPDNFFGYAGTGGLGLTSRYIFADKSKVPNMTYAELQFVKAEAAYKAGNKVAALQAYTNALNAHMTFVNARNAEIGSTSATQISAAEWAAFLASPNIMPTAATLTLQMIMSQKYIALWAWGHNELWLDMRRYHYTDLDPVTGTQVYPGFSPPPVSLLYVNNNGKVVQRIRPRYNSEYVWNFNALKVIGGDQLDYHTKPLWITQP